MEISPFGARPPPPPLKLQGTNMQIFFINKIITNKIIFCFTYILQIIKHTMKINSISHSVISQSEKRKKLQRYSKYLLIQSLNVWFCMVCYSELTSSLLSVSCCLFTGITTLTFSLDCKQIKTKSLLDAITSIFYCTLLLTQLPSIWCSCFSNTLYVYVYYIILYLCVMTFGNINIPSVSNKLRIKQDLII